MVDKQKQKEDKNMNRKLIRLTESDLHKIVKESVNIILNEVGETEGGQEKLARLAARKSFNGDKSYFDISDYAKGKRNGDLKKADLYSKTFHKEKDRLKNGIVKESVKRVLREGRFGRPEPFFGHEINGRSGMLYCMDSGERCVLYDLKFMGNCIIGRDRDTNEIKTVYLTSLFARPIDGSTIPSAMRQSDNVVQISHLRVDGSDDMWNLTVDDYFGSPEETAERDYASGY